jgi:hypothetical protein
MLHRSLRISDERSDSCCRRDQATRPWHSAGRISRRGVGRLAGRNTLGSPGGETACWSISSAAPGWLFEWRGLGLDVRAGGDGEQGSNAARPTRADFANDWDYRLAGLAAIFPTFAKAAWLSILPEFNPFKYNSFPVNAARQSFSPDRCAAKDCRPLRPGRSIRRIAPRDHLPVGHGCDRHDECCRLSLL